MSPSTATALKLVRTDTPPARAHREPSLSVQEAIAELMRRLPQADRSINGVARQVEVPPSTVLRWQRGSQPQPHMRRVLARVCKRYGINFR